MAIVLALLSAATYGVSDYVAGVASRRTRPATVAAVAQALGLVTALVALLLFSARAPHLRELGWGALSGVGSAVGTASLYRGLSLARMSVVATLSAVLTAVIPVLVGVLLGNHLGPAAIAGIVLAVPAIGLVSSSGAAGQADGPSAGTGALYGCLAGAGFALLFIALDRAGTRAGAWPLVAGQLVSLLCLIPVSLLGMRGERGPAPRTAAMMLLAGILSGTANLLYLAATGHGELAIVAVLAALYPAVTVLMARYLLAERWGRRQLAGLLAAAAAVVLVTLG